MEKQNFTEEFVSCKKEVKGRFLNFRIDEIKLPDGKFAEREYVKHGGAVAVIPVDGEGNVYLVRQYRYAVGEETLEIPAGKRDSFDEDPLEGGKRELKEELGITAEKFVSLGTFYPTPGYTDEVIYMYAAFGLTFGETDPDEDEFVLPEKIKLEKLVDMIMAGEIPDGKTQAAVLKVAHLLRKL